MTASGAQYFADSYSLARSRFREQAATHGWQLHSLACQPDGPGGVALTVDVASTGLDADKLLVVSSGVHGVEGYVGSALQLAVLHHAKKLGPDVGCLLIHAVNPFGFAWKRRWDENNVDLNRNFLLGGQLFSGCPDGYRKLDSLLNPSGLPGMMDCFLPQALLKVVQFGLPALKAAIAGGQYEFPRGLFFGGSEPSAASFRLGDILRNYIRPDQCVVHLDVHSGLGRWQDCQLLFDYQPDVANQDRLQRHFGVARCRFPGTHELAYEARGSLGRWCREQQFTSQYEVACMEFGTYHSIKVLAGLRRENRIYQAAGLNSPPRTTAAEQLKELFCPRSLRWRDAVITQGMTITRQAITFLNSQ